MNYVKTIIKKTVIIIVFTLVGLILLYCVADLCSRVKEKQQLNNIKFSVTISETVNSNKESNDFGKKCVSQTISIKSKYSINGMIFSVNSNDDSKYINAETLDGKEVDFPSNDYSFFSSDTQNEFTNYYYFSTEEEKRQIIQILKRDYHFKYEMDTMSFFGPYYKTEFFLPASEVIVN